MDTATFEGTFEGTSERTSEGTSTATSTRTDVIERLRSGLGEAVRRRITGDDRDERAHQLFEAPGPRWFGEDRPIRIVHGDAAMFVGGLAALLLQTLHPAAMAGVARHSDYRHDPWGRLQRTADFLAATTYGPRAEAERAVATVRAIHERVRGTTEEGLAYSATDPHLLRWVHVGEVHSFLTAHRRYGTTRLDAAGYDGYVEDLAQIASALGVPAPPRSVRALEDQLRGFRRELRLTPEAREAVRFLLVQPPLDAAARPVYGVLAAAAVGILPSWARRMLHLWPVPGLDRLAIQPAGLAVTRLLAWAAPPPERRAAASATRAS